MDSIIMPVISGEDFFVGAVFIFVILLAGYIGAVALGRKFNKDLPSKYRPEDGMISHLVIIMILTFIYFALSMVIFGIGDEIEGNRVQESRIEYFHDTYGVNLTGDQMKELKYPSDVPDKGVDKLYGTTTTWLDTESSSGPIEVGLAWVDDEFRLVPIGQQ